ncbi:hypothetical protein TEA_004490 [Camellia sinensis var. sinensis]|uniref:Uncharacterized protein n=1 Tax=Camellia sinensis var. sinensis TaxID=542762 RepID=A0A4S4EF65_CAMSN|nr:hypothetical protein TEA_004490 [Camellia sinensis var. sinensis]
MENKQSGGEDVSSAKAVLLGALAPGVNGQTWNTLKFAFLMLGLCLAAMLGLAFFSSDFGLIFHVTLLVLITGTLFILLSSTGTSKIVPYEYRVLTGCGYAYRYGGTHTGYAECMPGTVNTFGYGLGMPWVLGTLWVNSHAKRFRKKGMVYYHEVSRILGDTSVTGENEDLDALQIDSDNDNRDDQGKGKGKSKMAVLQLLVGDDSGSIEGGSTASCSLLKECMALLHAMEEILAPTYTKTLNKLASNPIKSEAFVDMPVGRMRDCVLNL